MRKTCDAPRQHSRGDITPNNKKTGIQYKLKRKGLDNSKSNRNVYSDKHCLIYVHKARRQLTFVVEPVDPVNTGALVVASEEKEVFWILDFVSEQETD